LFVAEADDVIAVLFELFCPRCITLWLKIMDVAVYFHHQAALGTVEVGDEWAQWMLSPEFQPV